MAFEIVTVPCLKDNYAFLLHDRATETTVLVDAPEAAPIARALEVRGWRLTDILITHHHGDHVDGVAALRAGVRVIGAAADAHRLPDLDLAVVPGQSFPLGSEEVHVIDVPGHTVGHVAYYFPVSGAVMTGDSLMALGCGRLFEGTAVQMWEGLQRIAALPGATSVCSGHEYAAANGRFAITIEPENTALQARIKAIDVSRNAGLPTVPSTLAMELRTNPYLRVHLPEMKAMLGMAGADDAAVFAEIRGRKDRF